MKAKRLTILVDFDDVMVDTLSAWVAWLNSRYGLSVPLEAVTCWDMCVAFPMLTSAQIYEPVLLEEFWVTVKPKLGAVEYMSRLNADGHRLLVVTHSDLSVLWFRVKNLALTYFPFLCADDIIVTKHKHLIRGDIRVDDRPENLEGGDGFKYLFTMPHNKDYDVNTSTLSGRVDNWEQLYAKILDLWERGVLGKVVSLVQ